MPSVQHSWLSHVTESPVIGEFRARLEATDPPHAIAHGSQGSSTTLLAGALARDTGRTVLLVVAHLDDADDALADLDLFSSDADTPLDVMCFGALEVLPGETNVSLELLAERLSVVGALLARRGQPDRPTVIIAPVQALMQSIPKPEAMSSFSLPLKVGQDFGPGKLTQWLADTGYERVDAIEQPGQFAVRGGIVDIHPPAGSTNGEPIRLDYFGDEIDTICRVDPDTLGSGDRLNSVELIGSKVDALQDDEHSTALWTVLPDSALVVLHEVLELSEQARGYYERLTNPRGIYPPQAVFKAMTQRPHVEINQYGSSAADRTIDVPARQLLSFDQDARKAVEELGALATSDEFGQVVVLCPKPAERDRLLELLRDLAPQSVDRLAVEVGFLHRGFVWGEGPTSLMLVPHQELFHRYDTRRRIRRVGSTSGLTTSAGGAAGTRASDAFLDVSPGDYVVHIDHGIARFIGLRAMEREGKTEEFLTLEFDNKAHLHVPAVQIDLIQKYVGGFHGRPPLSKLGGKRWNKQKESVREAVKDLAAELLRVQAARSSMPGVRYPADTAWQKEFEAEFPFAETEDQLAAIAAVKKDMSDEQPMDRLICGDVGFGKTEVAIRAAFKAAEYGKQVAVLVPTTVLAEQHERTFKGRMADYPFRIESLSRFKTAGEAKGILDKVQQGQVDVIIGTHRLLSKDVKFNDLGLVIIDEEQRFGVEHKNKLLQFRMTADVLTLSATPIPRTLHMSMLGLRDISSLSTPPMDRRAIVTEVIPYDEGRIKQALVRELSRDGQVYFVHNRVHNIKSVADDVRRLVPDARIGIGHGQMPGRELEAVMLKFMRKQIDVLVCTTIIESGIDIATANTMLINAADHFGLADLHQLRGRVGRYKHRAYCYLMLPENRTVTDKGAQRLKAIEQYSMLGAGFKIAMRDLEIRGAGNLLGAEQSGHIATVGYEMYCKLLEQETHKLKNEKVVEPVKTHMELPIAAQLPKAYISSDKFRMEAYRRLSRASSLEELDGVVNDLTDAYGKPPAAAQDLIDLTELRIALSIHEVDALKLETPDLIFKTHAPQKLQPVLTGAPGRTTVLDSETVYYRPPANYLTPQSTLLAILRKLVVRPLREKAEAVA